MSFSDLIKLTRHFFKVFIAIPIICMMLAIFALIFAPQTYEAKSTLLTNGDIALAGGFAQNEAKIYSQNGIEVNSTTDTAYRTITIVAEGNDYGGCIAAANATVIAAGEECRKANGQATVTINEATSAANISPSVPKMAVLALLAGIVLALCVIVAIDMVKGPIRSKRDIEETTGLPVVGTIPNRDRGERLLANVRFLSDETPSTIAVVPVGLTGGTLTCSELASAFEHANIPVTRTKGNPHAQSLNIAALPGIVTIVECAPISEGMGAVYIAKGADITLLCTSEWRDSRKALASVVEELRFAKANLGGVVFLSTSGYSEKGAL